MKVLVVDDQRNIVEFLESIIADKGHQVDTAYDGRQAFDLLQKVQYDLAIIDHNMPEMTGMELLKYMKEAGLPVRTVIISGYPNIQESFFRRLGVDEFIKKPFGIEDIEKILEKYAPN